MSNDGRQSDSFDRTRDLSASSPPTLAAYGVLVLVSIYYLLRYVDSANLPLSELLWNTFVHIVPDRMIKLLDSSSESSSSETTSVSSGGLDSISHASKSNALRRALRLDGKGVMPSVRRSRGLSDIGNVFRAKSPETLPGLGNWDHSCYQNSVLQGLTSVESLTTYLEQSASNSDGQTTKALRELTATLNDENNLGKTFWTPGVLKSMSSWQQQDAQEYFSKIMDALEKDATRNADRSLSSVGLKLLPTENTSNSPASTDILSQIEQDTNRVMARQKTSSLLRDQNHSTVVRNPLDGLLAQRVGCQRCGYAEGLSLVPFNCLTVPLGRQTTYSVGECLDDYTALESINGVECTSCTLRSARHRTAQLINRTAEACKGVTAEASKAAGMDGLLLSARKRLDAIEHYLEEGDFSDGVLKRCMVPPQQNVSTTKSRQAVIARAPKALIVHVNRSIFDEVSGEQRKNQAVVNFPLRLPLGQWCLGSDEMSEAENWRTDPMQSMLAERGKYKDPQMRPWYELRAVITHYGRHENGHYICYRRTPSRSRSLKTNSQEPLPWWRLSDEDVSQVSEEFVLAQGGVFMLFYEQIREDGQAIPTIGAKAYEVGETSPEADKTQQVSIDEITIQSADETPPETLADPKPEPHLLTMKSVSSQLDQNPPAIEGTGRQHAKARKNTTEPQDLSTKIPVKTFKATATEPEPSIHLRKPLNAGRTADLSGKDSSQHPGSVHDSGLLTTSASKAFSSPSPSPPLTTAISPRTGRHGTQGASVMPAMAGFVQAN